MEIKYLAFSVLIVLLLDKTQYTDAAGHMYMPAMRSAAWRYNDEKTPKNENEDNLNCGGIEHQWGKSFGNCGVCGDPYGSPLKPNEDNSGKYVTGYIAESYTEGSILNARIALTENEMGWFEFRLCPLQDRNVAVTQSCLDDRLLLSVDGKTRYHINNDQQGQDKSHVVFDEKHYFFIKLQLPEGVTCKQCVLQWWYKTGDCQFQICRKDRLTYVNCADISIKPKSEERVRDLDTVTESTYSTVTGQYTNTATPTLYPYDDNGHPYPGFDVDDDDLTTQWDTDSTSPSATTTTEYTTSPQSFEQKQLRTTCTPIDTLKRLLPIFSQLCSPNCTKCPRHCSCLPQPKMDPRYGNRQ